MDFTDKISAHLFYIESAADGIQEALDKQGTPKTAQDMGYIDWLNTPPEDRVFPIDTPEVRQAYIDAVAALRTAYIYARRVERHLAGKDEDKHFLSQLEKDLKVLADK